MCQLLWQSPQQFLHIRSLRLQVCRSSYPFSVIPDSSAHCMHVRPVPQWSQWILHQKIIPWYSYPSSLSAMYDSIRMISHQADMLNRGLSLKGLLGCLTGWGRSGWLRVILVISIIISSGDVRRIGQRECLTWWACHCRSQLIHRVSCQLRYLCCQSR